MVTRETFIRLLKSIGIEPINATVGKDARCEKDTICIEGTFDYDKLDRAAAILREKEMKKLFGCDSPRVDVKNETSRFLAKKILKNGDYMTVLWADGTNTVVKRAADEAESDYAAFTAALGIKCFGSNSALKRLVATAEEQGKKKKKKKQSEGNAEAGNPFEMVASEISKAFHEGDILRALEDIKEGNRAAYK